MRDQFLVGLTEERAARIQDLAELNKLFTAWVFSWGCRVQRRSVPALAQLRG